MRPANVCGNRQTYFYLSLMLASCLSTPAICQEDLITQTGGASQAAPDRKLAANTPLFNDIPSISISTFQPSKFKPRPVIESDKELKGTVTVSEQVSTPTQLIGRMMESAIAKDDAKELLESRGNLHNQKWTRLFGRGKEMLQFATDYQGFETSSEGADVILEEKLKLKHHAAVELVKQKRADAFHSKITCAVMQVAMGLGMPDPAKKDQLVESGRQELVSLIGEEEATQMVQSLGAWSRSVQVDETTFTRDPWDILTLQKKSNSLLATSVREDDVVKSIEKRLHKFNHHSNFARAAAKIIGTSTSIIAFSPTFASPAAQLAEFVFVSCTGGPEEKKVLREIYLDRCFESRLERLNKEVSLAANGYNQAVMTRNPVLFSCSRSLMEGLTDASTTATVTCESEAVLDEASNKAFGERI